MRTEKQLSLACWQANRMLDETIKATTAALFLGMIKAKQETPKHCVYIKLYYSTRRII
jgi:hypothetical protein